MMNCDTKAIGDWLAAGARSAPDAEDMVGQVCDRLVGCEISLSRVGLFVLTLHPQIMGRRYLWEPGRQVDVMRWNGPLRQHLVLKRGRCSNATKEGPFHEI